MSPPAVYDWEALGGRRIQYYLIFQVSRTFATSIDRYPASISTNCASRDYSIYLIMMFSIGFRSVYEGTPRMLQKLLVLQSLTSLKQQEILRANRSLLPG